MSPDNHSPRRPGAHRRPLFAVLAAWLAAACAAPTPPVAENAVPFPEPAAREVFESAYASISEKYLEVVSPASFAVEGMRGLGAIDPGLAVNRTGDTLTLLAADKVLARFPAPADGDVKGWAALTVSVSAAGRRTSRELSAASPEAIYEAVFDGALSKLDIFSRYAGAEEAKRNRAKRDGFGGIGISYRISDAKAVVTRVLPKTPAARAGMKRNDVITHVGAVPVSGLDKYGITAQIRGPVSSQVEITVRRKPSTEALRFTMIREHIVPDTVTYGSEDGVIFLKVSGFNQKTASSVEANIEKAKKAYADRLKGFVLDLRGNPGGLLKQSIKIVDLFLAQGKIVSTRGRHPDSLQFYLASGADKAGGLPLVVLVDGKSASASEVIAAALQDRGRAVVIGTSSYGKGSVQTVIHLPNSGEITLTWSRLLAPSGYVFHGLGVFPSICTSGVEGNAFGLIEESLAKKEAIAAVLAAWRKTGVGDEEERRRLRTSCPAQKRRHPVEIEVARRLIANKAFFARALGISSATATAQF